MEICTGEKVNARQRDGSQTCYDVWWDEQIKIRFPLEATRMDRVRNEYISGMAQFEQFGDKVREASPRWFGHVQRRDSGYIGPVILNSQVGGKNEDPREDQGKKMDGWVAYIPFTQIQCG